MLWKLMGRSYFVAWALSFTALIGFIGAIMTIFPDVKQSTRDSAILAALAVATAGIYALARAKPSHLPLSDMLPEELSDTPECSLKCVTDRDPVMQVHRLTKEVYPGVDPLPVRRYEEWLAVNPNIFVCLFARSGKVLGYFDVFPLRPDFMHMLIEGRVGEQDIRKEHIQAPADADTTDALYLGGVASALWHRGEGKRHGAMLIWGLVKYLDAYYVRAHPRLLYAHAVSPEGTKLLEKFRFRLIAEASGRRDAYPLYVAELNAASLDLVQRNLPDLSAMLTVSWEP